MQNMQTQSRFSRTVANIAKAGAYYTNTACCRALGQMLEFPQGEEVCCLEPAIGDGEAILAVTGKTGKDDNIKIFGVDINKDTILKDKENPLLDEVLEADFLNGITLTGNVFSFCFSNPPYMEIEGDRAEKLFLLKIADKMKRGGVLVYVIPEYIFAERGFFRILYNRFHIESVWRFPEDEYSKWKQVGIIARKRPASKNALKDEIDEMLEKLAGKEQIPTLPMQYDGEKVMVFPSESEKIGVFAPILFPREDFLGYLKTGAGMVQLREADADLKRQLKVESVYTDRLENPPIHPNNDSMYLLAVCGAGNGLCGNSKDGTLHLQRGTVSMKEDAFVEEGATEGTGTLVVTKRAAITYKVIEQSGKITTLE